MSAPAQKELSSGPVKIRTFILPSSPTMSIETQQQDQKPIIEFIIQHKFLKLNLQH